MFGGKCRKLFELIAGGINISMYSDMCDSDNCGFN